MEKQYTCYKLEDDPSTNLNDKLYGFGLDKEGQKKIDYLYDHPWLLNPSTVAKIYREHGFVIR